MTRELGIFPTSNYPVQYLGRGSDGRTPVYSQTDLFVQHTSAWRAARQLQLSLNVLNLFNQDTPVGKFSTYQQVNGVDAERGAVLHGPADAGVADPVADTSSRRDPRFLMDNASRRRSRRASASSSCSRRAEDDVRLSCAPRASARGAFFLTSEVAMRIRLACHHWLVSPFCARAALRPAPAQPNRGRAMPPVQGSDSRSCEPSRGKRPPTAFQQAIDIDPTFEMAYYALGRATMPQKNYAEAVSALRKCRDLYPRTGRHGSSPTSRKHSATAANA